MTTSRGLLFAYLAFLSISEANSVRCYICTPCKELTFDPSGRGVYVLDDCTGSCLKTYRKDNGDTMRICSGVSYGERCERTDKDGVEEEWCSCITDLCNRATWLDVSMATVVASVLIVLIWLWRLR